MGNLIASILLWPFKVLAFIGLLFYEWGWEPLARWVARLARFRRIAALERAIRSAPPRVALLLFLLPTLFLLPVKLGAVWMIAHGKKLLGVAMIVFAKIIGTAILAWIFKLTQPALMKLRWFAWVYLRVHAWKSRWITQIKATQIWMAAARLRARLKPVFAALRAQLIFWK